MTGHKPSLVLATRNEGKLAEFRALFGRDVVIRSLVEIGLDSPEETGSTFSENAVLKAVHAASATGSVAVADDSGIVVDALGGAPGVRSARFAGPDASDADNRALLLRRLYGVPAHRRRARFICVVAIAHPDGDVRTFEGTLEGHVTDALRGTRGFGYDSVFELDNGSTLAEVSSDLKNSISHRAAALKKALPYIHDILSIEP